MSKSENTKEYGGEKNLNKKVTIFLINETMKETGKQQKKLN